MDDADDADVDGIILRVAVIAIDRIGTARNETKRNETERTMRAESTSGQRTRVPILNPTNYIHIQTPDVECNARFFKQTR